MMLNTRLTNVTHEGDWNGRNSYRMDYIHGQTEVEIYVHTDGAVTTMQTDTYGDYDIGADAVEAIEAHADAWVAEHGRSLGEVEF